MSQEETSTKKKILAVTIQLLFQKDPEDITTRQIAGQAGVNVAAINYHFQTKENLVDEAVLSAASAAFDQGMLLLRNRSMPPAERLRRFFEGYAAGLVAYQGITKTAFRNLLMKEHGNDTYAVFLKGILVAISEALAEIRDSVAAGAGVGEAGPGGGTGENKLLALLLYSGIAFPFLIMGSLRGISGLDFHDDAERNRYIELMLKAVSPKKE